jgi:hypothetical protein
VVLLVGQRISNQETHHCSVRTYYSRPALFRYGLHLPALPAMKIAAISSGKSARL